jgi:uncharacterized protein YyaL (SSP411 family)
MASLRVLPRDVAWLPWSAEAFARARRERKPVLLCVATAWSQSCYEMDRTSYADPSIAFLINDAFIPVRVDADRRPDISERYNLGGWPTTAFLTPDGEVLGGGTYVDPSRMARVLEDVRAAFQCGAAEGSARSGRVIETAVSRSPAPDAPDGDVLFARIFDDYDAEYGGFGTMSKFPHTAPLRLALQRYRRAPDARLESIVSTTLDAMGWGGLYDEADGGFFRHAATRDWQQPHREKTLEVNAQLLDVYTEAADAFKVARFGERAADVLRYVQNWLSDQQDGGWYGSQRSGDGHIDTAFYADANAAMASATLGAAAVFDDSSLRDFALKSLERVLLACYKPGHGVAHYFDGGPQVRGLLADQVAMASAQLDAFEVTGNVVYEMMAEELAHYAVREMWDADAGGFFDRAAGDDADAVGLMRVRLKPFVTNCEAARMLKRLASTSGDAEFARFANETLDSVGPAAAEQGPLAAYYLLAVDQ